MIERLENIMNTIDRMEKWKGHLYNWYDTISLVPLTPIFVSTVDSGNLMAALLCSAQIIRRQLKDMTAKIINCTEIKFLLHRHMVFLTLSIL